MKNICILRRIVSLLFFCFTALLSQAQPIGSKTNPVIVGTFPSLPYSNTRNNSPANNYGNNIGNSSHDIWYKVVISTPGQFNVSTCTSTFDTYLWLLDDNFNTISSNDDSQLCGNFYQAAIKTRLNPGTYYVVAEGYSSQNGNINTYISFARDGSSAYNPINIGTLSQGTTYTDTRNNSTSNYYFNMMGNSSDDIYYTFSLNHSALLNMSHCGSPFDTYMYLLDENHNIIASNDDNGDVCPGTMQASLRMQLNPGTYYVVSEGWSTSSGDITTSISVARDISYTEYIDSLLDDVDLSHVTTGVLYDRVFGLSGLQEFNYTQPDTSNYSHFIQAYSEFNRSSYTSTGLPSVKAFKNSVLQKKINGYVPVGISNYEFNVIDTNAITSGLLYMDNDSLLHDVPNRPMSPFKTINTFISSPLVDSVAGPVVTYHFSPSFMINKSSTTISSLQVDFNNGNGLVNVGLNSNINVTYNSSGYKHLKFVASFNNSTSITTYASVKVIPSITSSSPCEPDTKEIWSNLLFQGYSEGIATKGKGEVDIYYATNRTCDGILRKPIIVVDGFDPGDDRNGKAIYNKYLDVLLADNSRVASSLRSEGFDIVILNFPVYQTGTEMRDGGADYIERNARVLIALIDSVNGVKQGNEKLVVIGPSMGGLISRYALRYMELNNMLHNTELWISFDSPHKGANIPIGDQWFLDFYAENTGDEKLIDARDNQISSVAAKQMLVNHFRAYSSEYPAGAPGFYDRFYNDINQMGFPVGDLGQQFRKIALINGSLGGIETNAAEQKGFTFDIHRWKSMFFGIVKFKSFTVSSARMYFTQSWGNTGYGTTVFDGWYLWKDSRVRNSRTPNYTSGHDVAPGGTFATQKTLKDGGDGAIERKYFKNFKANFYSVVEDHCFINTKSALAYSGTNLNLSENVRYRNLVCTEETPFDSYFGSFYNNSQHISFWPAAKNWVIEEIKGNPQSPSFENANSSYVGIYQQNCIGGSEWEVTFKAYPTLPDAEYIWVYNGTELPPTTNPELSTYESTNYSVNINLKIKDACGNYVPVYSSDATFYSPCNYYSFSVFPNPANDEIIVSADKDQSAETLQSKDFNSKKTFKEISFEIKLFDDKGKELRTAKNETGKKNAIIHTRDVPNGTYYLHIIEGKKVIKKQMVIQH